MSCERFDPKLLFCVHPRTKKSTALFFYLSDLIMFTISGVVYKFVKLFYFIFYFYFIEFVNFFQNFRAAWFINLPIYRPASVDPLKIESLT